MADSGRDWRSLALGFGAIQIEPVPSWDAGASSRRGLISSLEVVEH